MSTIRQKKLAHNIVENLQREQPLNKQELVVSSGYSEISAESSAHLIIEQKGVQEELKKLGFDPERAKEVVGQILLEGENDNVKLKAAEMVFKVHGSFAPEKRVNVNVEIEANEKIKEAAKLLNDQYRTKEV